MHQHRCKCIFVADVPAKADDRGAAVLAATVDNIEPMLAWDVGDLLEGAARVPLAKLVLENANISERCSENATHKLAERG